MRIDDLRKTLHAHPFRPFRIRVADGREYPVVHPDFIAVDPGGRTVIVFDEKGVHEVVYALMITSLHVGNGGKSRKRRNA